MKSKILHCTIFFTLFFFSCVNAFSETYLAPVEFGEEDWRYLEKAKNSFNKGNYGDAIEEAEKARESRKQRCKWEIFTLERTLRYASVRRADGNFDELLKVLDDKHLNDAANIIRIHLSVRSASHYNNSINGIISYEEVLMNYPEVDHLIANIYKMEGEFPLAIQYMQSAYNSIEILNVPEEKYNIIYDLADLYYDVGDTDNFEKYMLVVLNDNEDYKNTSLKNAVMSVISRDTLESVEKFFLLYRSQYSFSLKAFVSLCEFYNSIPEKQEEALECAALGSLCALTLIEQTLQERINDYSYIDFRYTLKSLAEYEDIVEWGNKNEIWKLFYLLGDTSSKNQKLNFATGLFKILSQYLPDNYWRLLSERRLIK